MIVYPSSTLILIDITSCDVPLKLLTFLPADLFLAFYLLLFFGSFFFLLHFLWLVSLSFSLWQETISSAAFNLNASFRIFQSPFCRFLNRYAILPSFSLPDRLYRFVPFRSAHEERVPSSKTALTWNHPLLLSLIYL